MRYFRFIFSILALFILVSPASGRIGSTAVSSDPTVSINITTAYYADLEGDGLENDIFVGVVLSFVGASTYSFDYYIFLTLPSGTEYGYTFSAATKTEILNLDNYLWNHATEAGWYKVTIYIVLKTGGAQLVTESLIFDPPGGSGGADPIGTSVVIY